MFISTHFLARIYTNDATSGLAGTSREFLIEGKLTGVRGDKWVREREREGATASHGEDVRSKFHWKLPHTARIESSAARRTISTFSSEASASSSAAIHRRTAQAWTGASTLSNSPDRVEFAIRRPTECPPLLKCSQMVPARPEPARKGGWAARRYSHRGDKPTLVSVTTWVAAVQCQRSDNESTKMQQWREKVAGEMASPRSTSPLRAITICRDRSNSRRNTFDS